MVLAIDRLPLLSSADLQVYQRRIKEPGSAAVLLEIIDEHAALWADQLGTKISLLHQWNETRSQLHFIATVGPITVPIWLTPYQLGWAVEYPKDVLERLAAAILDAYKERFKLAERHQAVAGLLADLLPLFLPRVTAWTTTFENVFLIDNIAPARDWRIKVECELLANDLALQSQCFFIRDGSEVQRALTSVAEVQTRRWLAREQRTAHPRQTAADPFAAVLMKVLKAKVGKMARLEEGRRVEPGRPAIIDGVEFRYIAFWLEDGLIRVDFDCDAAKYAGGRLELHATLPQTFFQSLRGRPLSDLIAGSIFERVAATITAIGSKGRCDYVELDTPCVWVDLSSSDNAQV